MRPLGALIGMLVVVLLLRSTALSALSARGIILDVLAFATVLWALRYGESWGASFGFVLGLAADLDSAHWLGRHALALSLIGFVVGRLSGTLVRESARTLLVLLAAATALHQTLAVSFEVGGLAGWPYVIQRVALATIFTAPVGAFLFLLARRLAGQPLLGDGSHGPGSSA